MFSSKHRLFREENLLIFPAFSCTASNCKTTASLLIKLTGMKLLVCLLIKLLEFQDFFLKTVMK